MRPWSVSPEGYILAVGGPPPPPENPSGRGMTKDQTHPHEWHVQAVLDRLRRPDSPVCVGKHWRPLDWPGRRRRMQSLPLHPLHCAGDSSSLAHSKRNHRRAHPSFGKRLTDIMNVLIGPETQTVGNQSTGMLFRVNRPLSITPPPPEVRSPRNFSLPCNLLVSA